MATISQIQKLYSQYMGFTPSSQDTSKMSMMSPAEIEDLLKNSKTDIQSQATEKAQSAISSLMAPGGETLPSNVSSYLTTMAQGRETLSEQYGLTEAEKRLKEAEDFYKGIAEKGPMLETAMTGGLQAASPTFLGATRKQLEEKLAGIPNPFVRDSMINNYLSAADKSMTATLKALNGLYQTSIMAAQNALEGEQDKYSKIADKVKDLYSELQWVNRERFNEEQKSGADNTRFWSEIDAAKNELQQGEPWGNVWNRIKMQFPNISNEMIDNALGGSIDMNKYIQDPNNPNASILNPNYGKGTGWAKGGAFEEFKAKGKTTTPSQWEYDAGIWEWLSSEGSNLSDEEKSQQIKQMGRNPESFGLYGY